MKRIISRIPPMKILSRLEFIDFAVRHPVLVKPVATLQHVRHHALLVRTLSETRTQSLDYRRTTQACQRTGTALSSRRKLKIMVQSKEMLLRLSPPLLCFLSVPQVASTGSFALLYFLFKRNPLAHIAFIQQQASCGSCDLLCMLKPLVCWS